MATNDTTFFSPRSQRDVLDYVLSDFPFPLALTYARLQEEMDRQEPIAAAWQLRDAFESLLKFTAGVALADFFQSEPNSTEIGKLAGLILKPNGLSLGDWHTLVEEALKPLAPLARDNRLAECGRMFSGLYTCFFKLNGKRTLLNVKIDGPDSFVSWRNRVFGHGVFKQERQWYAEETLRWLPVLNEFYSVIKPVFEGWTLCNRDINGRELVWQGAHDVTSSTPHQHAPAGEPAPMFFRSHDVTRELSFGPLLSVQQCAICQQPAMFFFDRNKYEREKNLHKTYFLEYFRGHSGGHKDWQEVRNLAARLPVNFEWQRGSYDALEMEEGLRVVFRNLDDEYLRPNYLLDAIWRVVDERTKGYIHLVGEEGVGKSSIVRGLERDGKKRNNPVLAYHILPGALSDYRTFISELADRAKECFRFHTQEIQTKVATHIELQGQFVEFLKTLMEANKLDTLVVAVDALDELPEPSPESAAITDFLPAADKLPDGCFIILTSRPALRPKIRARLQELAKDSNDSFTALELQPGLEANRQVIRAYLEKHLPEPFCAPSQIEQLLQRSGGVFLYAYHFCRAIEAGVVRDAAILSDGDRFYAFYLSRLRERVGEHLFETAYLPILLFLSAARRPVTIPQLERWGIPRDRLVYALLDLRDFLHVHRQANWHDSLSESEEKHYSMAHEAFVRFLQEDPQLSERLRETHATIARHALAAHSGHWDKLDPADDAELYDLRYVMAHVRAAKLDKEMNNLMTDETFASACVDIGSVALTIFRAYLALDLAELALTFYGDTAIVFGKSKWNKFVILPLGIKADALFYLGHNGDAMSAIDSAIIMSRQLISEAHQNDLIIHLASSLSRKAWFLAQTGRPTEALPYNDEAIAITRQFVEGGDHEGMSFLAGFLNDKGATLDNLMLSAEAVTCYDESILIRRRIVDMSRNCLDDVRDLGTSLSNRGCALSKLHRFNEAIISFSEATRIYRELINDQGQIQLLQFFGRVLEGECLAFSRIGRYQEAITASDEAMTIIRRLVEVDGRLELSNDLADSLGLKGWMLSPTANR